MAILLAACCTTSRAAEPSAPGIQVSVDPRVELVGIIFRLAGYDEYRMGRVPGYLKDVDAHFGPYKDHPAITMAQNLRSSHSIGFDACMSLAVHLSHKTPVTISRPVKNKDASLERRWDKAAAEEFARQAAAFAEATGFDKFFADHEPLYARSAARMEEVLRRDAHLEWFEAFYGARPTAAFHLVLGMLNGPANYGPHFTAADGSERLYCIFGVEETDEQGDPVFQSRIAATIAHEFSHSFVNHVVEANRDRLETAGMALFAAAEARMRRLAYGNWKTVLDESLVRAATVRYLQTHTTPEQAQKQLSWEINSQGFIWLGDLVDLLVEFEKSRDRYPTFASFMPEVAAFFDERTPGYVESMHQTQATEAANKPTIVSTSPENGAKDVDPSTNQIVITFDRPMRPGGYSVMYVDPDGTEHFPNVTGKLAYDRAGKILTIPVQLKPNWTYRFALNDESGGAFKSREGGVLDRYEIAFTTGPER